jgi:glycosyltransferase involved in cell wall biosynthesis
MKILLTVEFYHPSVGGAQKVVSEIAEHLARKKFKVYVATSQIYEKQKKKEIINLVNVRRFNISGNYIENFIGEKENYINFLIKNKFDTIFFYAAQQWTFDLALDILKKIKSKKILCPCGFSRLNKFAYRRYFQKIAENINDFDKIIFHSSQYQDYFYLKKFLKKKNFSVIPNAADSNFINFKKNNYSNNSKKFLNVSNFTPGKRQDISIFIAIVISLFLRSKIKFYFVGNTVKVKNFTKNFFYHIFYFYLNLLRIFFNVIFIDKEIIFLKNLKRNNVINIFKKSDFFLFTSKVECSPIVIFEALGAGLPFFSLNSGNIAEIARKTNAGICAENFIKLSMSIIRIINNTRRLKEMSKNGILNCKRIYNWKNIVKKYENLF